MKFRIKNQRAGKIIQFNSALTSILDEYDLKDSFFIQKIREKWHKIAGDIISTHSRPQRIFKKILYINADHSIYANELSLMKDMLVNEINNEYGFDVINDIRIKINRLDWKKDIRR